MVTKIQKWGNSQGLRLAKHVLENARIALGDDVEVIVGEEQITIKKVVRPKYNLAEMVARMPRDYRAREVSLGKPVGREEW
ncbi:MAG: transcriptional regulator/antitoxin, MazE [Acidobacteria bacterium]|nr:transcriptional regulator/antitoxin, MazE [Acidobacteriota bacterium]